MTIKQQQNTRLTVLRQLDMAAFVFLIYSCKETNGKLERIEREKGMGKQKIRRKKAKTTP